MCRVVPVAAIVPVFEAKTYGHYRGTTITAVRIEVLCAIGFLICIFIYPPADGEK